MSNYIPTGAPVASSRGTTPAIRNEFVAIAAAVNSKADAAGGALTGAQNFTGATITVPTKTALDNSLNAASTAYADAAVAAEAAIRVTYAPLASPALTGVPTAPTAAAGTATNQIATMAALVAQAFSSALPGISGATTGKFVTNNGTSASWAAVSLSGTSTAAINANEIDKGTVSSGTVTFTQSVANVQRLQVGGALTIATTGWPTAGTFGELLLKLVNGGAYTVTLPTINWIKPDGTLTTTFATYLTAISRPALQTSGTDFMYLFSDDAGTTLYGKLL